MSAIRLNFLMLVAVLSIAPSIVFAQQSSAQLLLEVQALRAEIAELRDMVERQQYRLDRMKVGTGSPRQGSPRIGVPTNQSTTQPNTVDPSNQLPNYGQPNTAVDSGTYNTQPVDNQNGSYTQTPPTQLPQTAPAQNQPQEVNPQQPAGNDGFYQPDTQTAPVEPQQSQPQPSRPSPESGNQYPPVEDRSIGGGSAVITPQPNAPTSNQPLPNTSVPVQNSGEVVAQQGSVIAVPNAGSQVAYNQVPTQNSGANSQAAAPAAAIPEQIPEQELYQRAFDLLKQSKHDDAVAVFKEQLELYPEGEAADDANYWIAETSYVNRDLKESKQYFKTIIEKFPQSSRLPDALLKTAYIEQEQGNVIEARVLLQEIVHYHPRSNAAISAKNRLAELN